MIALLMVQHAPQVQRIGVVRLRREDFVIEKPGRTELAGLVQGNCVGQNFLHNDARDLSRGLASVVRGGTARRQADNGGLVGGVCLLGRQAQTQRFPECRQRE